MKSPSDIVVVGIDPGPRPGMVALRYSPPETGTGIRHLTANPAIVQCTSNVLVVCLRAILPTDVQMIIIAYERVVIGPLAAKVARRKTLNETARQGGLIESLKDNDSRLIIRGRGASDVMTWGSDERLERMGLLEATKGMVHARAAARHAIYSAHKDINAPDPLSRKHRKVEVSA